MRDFHITLVLITVLILCILGLVFIVFGGDEDGYCKAYNQTPHDVVGYNETYQISSSVVTNGANIFVFVKNDDKYVQQILPSSLVTFITTGKNNNNSLTIYHKPYYVKYYWYVNGAPCLPNNEGEREYFIRIPNESVIKYIG